MEDFLILLLQAMGEFLLELFAWGPWDWFWYWGPNDRPHRDDSGWVVALLSIFVGALIGWGSLYVFPAVLVKWAWLRVALLFVSPPISGLMARQMAIVRHRRDENISPNFHFFIGLCFSIGFVWTRFALAHRPG